MQKRNILHTVRERLKRRRTKSTKDGVTVPVDDVLTAELLLLAKRRGKRQDSADVQDTLAGLALSGGGIRSATFGLGVLQALAGADRLRRFDYLSTVSGGGYLGSALTWWRGPEMRRMLREHDRKHNVETRVGLGPTDFPFGTGSPFGGDIEDILPSDGDSDEARTTREVPLSNRLLRFAREHGRYLTPGRGLDLAALLAAVIRASLVNMLVWLPLLTVLFLGLLWGNPGRSWTEARDALRSVEWLSAGAPDVGGGAGSAWQGLHKVPRHVVAPLGHNTPPLERRLKLAERAFFSTVSGFLILTILYPLSTTWPRRWRFPGLGRLRLPDPIARVLNRYRARRGIERCTGVLLIATCVTGFVAALPWIAVWSLQREGPGDGDAVAAAGVWAVLSGFAAGIGAFYRSAQGIVEGTSRTGRPRLSTGMLATAGAGLLLVGASLLAYELAFGVFDAANKGRHAPLRWLLGLTALGVILGWRMNFNYIGLHRLYRDRLMELFLPPLGRVLSNRPGASPEADKAPLHEFAEEDCEGLYHLVNAHAILVDSRDQTLRIRGGDSFLLSPLFCGSVATGYRPTPDFAVGQVTLSTAVAVSGAAAEPNTGVGGAGPTRSKALSLLMALLNLRLGYWVPNPRRRYQRSRTPSALRVLGYQLSPNGFEESSDNVELSDGGHFDNLGLYELVRRRCRVIVVVDGAQDAGYRFGDLRNAIARIETDFGAVVCFTNRSKRSSVLPNALAKDEENPGPFVSMIPTGDEDTLARSAFSRTGVLEATIRFGDDPRTICRLFYIKSTFVRSDDLVLRNYKVDHPAFPHETTADQFFSDRQFEAYRRLGYAIASSAVDSVGQALDDLSAARTRTATT